MTTAKPSPIEALMLELTADQAMTIEAHLHDLNNTILGQDNIIEKLRERAQLAERDCDHLVERCADLVDSIEVVIKLLQLSLPIVSTYDIQGRINLIRLYLQDAVEHDDLDAEQDQSDSITGAGEIRESSEFVSLDDLPF